MLFAPSSLSSFCLPGMQVLPYWTGRARPPPRDDEQCVRQGLHPREQQSHHSSPGLHASTCLYQRKTKLLCKPWELGRDTAYKFGTPGGLFAYYMD